MYDTYILNQLRLNRCRNTWCVLENVPCTLERNVVLLLGSMIFMSIRSAWFIVLYKSSVSSGCFYLLLVLKSLTIIIELSMYLFSFVSFCFTYFDGLLLAV